MPKLFISYRREDSAYPAHSICERLKSHFGKDSVFIDVDTIPYGADFRKHLNDAVGKCDVLLAVIGSKWLDSRQEDGTRRLDDPRDFVRIEIEAALHRDIPVIPVLVDQVGMPKNTLLPGELSELAFRNAAQVRPGLDFNSDLDRLVRGLQKLLKLEPGQTPVPSPAEKAAAPQPVSAPVASPISVPPASKAEVPSTPHHKIVKPDDIITNSIGMKLALIPAGEFLMGSPDADRMADDNERPQHRVGITTPFYLGAYPVTQAEYKHVMGENPSRFNADERRPVEQVSWFDAVAFCNELSELEGLPPYYNVRGEFVSIVGGGGYRLPTEAEWEYACHAGTTTRWSSSKLQSALQEYAWFSENSGMVTHPVGEKKPNPWGLYDMHGNVWDWCWDWYGENYYKDSPANDPMGPTDGVCRVMRGGAINDNSSLQRSTRRNSGPPTYRHCDSGFRAARTLPLAPLAPAEKSAAQQQVSAPVATPITVPPASTAEPPSTPPHEIVKTGDIITNTIGQKLTLIPAGKFVMGSPNSEEMGSYREQLQHHVEITTPFYLGMFPVTQNEYQKVIKDNPSYNKYSDRCPVERVSWFDAVAFCNKLSKVEQLPPYYKVTGDSVSIVGGSGYRLPTEAEWEYACRAETTTRWSFGNNQSQLRDYAWFDANSGNTTHPVGEKKPNPWGLYDMHGNVWEWCGDWMCNDRYQDSPASDPIGPTEGTDRVMRGCSFDAPLSDVRSAYRGSLQPTTRIDSIGFRVARTLSPVP